MGLTYKITNIDKCRLYSTRKEVKRMAILDDVLKGELDRSKRMREAMVRERASLPSGYISEKKIKGREYSYLQRRNRDKIISEYIDPNNLEEIKEKVYRRKALEKSIRELDENIKKLSKVLR